MSTVPVRRGALLAGIVLAGGLALVGCSGSSGTSSDAPSGSVVGSVDSSSLGLGEDPGFAESAAASPAPIPAELPLFEGGEMSSSSVADDSSYFEVVWTTSDSPTDAVTAYGKLFETAGYTAADAYADTDVAGVTLTGSKYVVAVQAYTLDGLTYISANGTSVTPPS
ncbi:MAG: hypothetical protein PSX37_00025 [bacterium]|nr:hypothetical protein [bacterium]